MRDSTPLLGARASSSIQDSNRTSGDDTANSAQLLKAEGVAEYKRVGTVPGAVFNLSNSILGGGISLLALPSAVQSAGPVLFLALLVVSGVATVASAQLLADAAEIASAQSYVQKGKLATLRIRVDIKDT